MKTINQLWKGWMVLCLLCLAACSDQDMDLGTGTGQPGERGIWLTFQQPGEKDADGGNAARSTLQSSEVSYKDVKEVYLYIFDGTDAKAECTVKSTVKWNENKDENGQITKKVWVTADLVTGRTYTFMAVGWDDRADATYGFPDAIVAQTENTPGTKLGDCLAKLQLQKRNEESEEQYTVRCMDAMAHSQIFVGTTTKTVASSAEDVAVTLSRKMAGILVYLRNIPVSVTYKEKACQVKTLEVRLHKNQHTSLKIWKQQSEQQGQEQQPNGQPVFGEGELPSSQVLFNLNLTTEESGFKPDENGRYFTKESNDSVLADSYLAGAYLLPMDKTQATSTISVNLRGSYTDGAGQTTEDIILKSYVVRYKHTQKDPKPGSGSQTTTYTEDYPLEENKLYAIGKKLSNSTTVNDEPADLSGNLLELTVMPWRKLGSTHTFPTVTGPARIEADYNENLYVRDALEDTLTFTVKPAVDKDPAIKKQWTLTVNYGDGLKAPDDRHGNKEFGELPKDWIHFIAYDKEGKFVQYTDTLTGYDEQEVIAIVNHYAVERELANKSYFYMPEDLKKFKNDIRRAVIEVKTQDVNEPYPLLVQQYNTLTIKTSDDYQNPRGIARLDYDCEFNKQTGEMMGRDSCAVDWGYFKTGNLYVSGDNPMNYTDGEITSDKCYNRWKNDVWAAKAYKGSAIQKLTKRFVQIETIYDEKGNKLRIVDKNPANEDDHTKEKNWYMPAYYEMWGIARTARYDMVDDLQLEEMLNMKKEDVYWTSSGDDGLIGDAYITRIGHYEKSEHKDKNRFYFTRQMIKFPPKR